jgi:hypothetical protein
MLCFAIRSRRENLGTVRTHRASPSSSVLDSAPVARSGDRPFPHRHKYDPSSDTSPPFCQDASPDAGRAPTRRARPHRIDRQSWPAADYQPDSRGAGTMTTAQRRSPSRPQPLAGLSASRLARALARVSARHDFAAPGTFPWQTGRSAGPEQSLRAVVLSRDRFYAIREASESHWTSSAGGIP